MNCFEVCIVFIDINEFVGFFLIYTCLDLYNVFRLLHLPDEPTCSVFFLTSYVDYATCNSYIANKRGFVQIIPPSWSLSYQFDWHAINCSRRSLFSRGSSKLEQTVIFLRNAMIFPVDLRKTSTLTMEKNIRRGTSVYHFILLMVI